MKKEKTISLNRFANIIINKLLFNMENEKIDCFFSLVASAAIAAIVAVVVISF